MMQIFVRLPNDTVMVLDLAESTPVKKVKQMVHEAKGLPLSRQRLFFGGKPLYDEFSLAHYNITKVRTASIVLGASPVLTHLRLSLNAQNSTLSLQLKFRPASPSSSRCPTPQTRVLIRPSEPEDTEWLCVICRSLFAPSEQLVVLPCQHRFHLDCLRPWFSSTSTCPICRLEVAPGADVKQSPSSTPTKKRPP